MRRLHLFEFGDQPWFPQSFHDAETAFLSVLYRLFPSLPRQWAGKIATVLRPGEPTRMLDLCSGTGGAIPMIVEDLAAQGFDVRVTLSDLYPNPKFAATHPRATWFAEPVDATHVPPNLGSVRTMFSAFHHFRPDAAKAILKDAFDNRCAICIFESGPGTKLGVAMAVLVPQHVLAMMPFARPFRWEYFVFTYLIPVIPLILLWDSIVSNLRVYSPQQMKEMTEDLRAPDYAWEMGRIRLLGLMGVPYLIGRPKFPIT